jgi:hypothetical protein
MSAGTRDRAAAGTLEARVDGTYVLRFERRLAHPPEKVWRALTEPDQLRQWFPTDIEGERKLGAKLLFVFRDDAPRAEDMPELLEHDPEDLEGSSPSSTRRACSPTPGATRTCAGSSNRPGMAVCSP